MKMTKGKAAGAATLITAIVLTVTSLIGKEEKPNNSGFKDPVFEKEMRAVGFHTGDSWCVFTCIYTYHKVLKDAWPKADSVLMKLASGNSQSFYRNVSLDKSGYFFITDSAMVGSICIWQHYKNGVGQWSGHAGLVDTVFRQGYKYDYHDVEGNTNSNGSSNGTTVLPKYRRYNWTNQNGLRNKGFIMINIRRAIP